MLIIKFSVLMSVYKKENPIYLSDSLESILVNQNLKPDELVLVKDGPLTDELEKVITRIRAFLQILKLYFYLMHLLLCLILFRFR